jgi:hypothetical protein
VFARMESEASESLIHPADLRHGLLDCGVVVRLRFPTMGIKEVEERERRAGERRARALEHYKTNPTPKNEAVYDRANAAYEKALHEYIDERNREWEAYQRSQKR